VAVYGALGLRGFLVRISDLFRISTLGHRRGTEQDRIRPLLHPWPLPYPRDWEARVDHPETEAEPEAVRRSVERNQPFGAEAWQERTAKLMNLEYTFRKPGRPKKGCLSGEYRQMRGRQSRTRRSPSGEIPEIPQMTSAGSVGQV